MLYPGLFISAMRGFFLVRVIAVGHASGASGVDCDVAINFCGDSF